MSLLEVENLVVRYPGAPRAAVEDLSFSVEAGESVALAGESGSGKTQTALALMGLSPVEAVVEGTARFDGQNLFTATPSARRALSARGIAMIFQDPSSALNPHLTIARQLMIVLDEHGLAKGQEAKERVVRMLERTGLPDPERQARAYPWQLSGGMRQRVMIASALLTEPKLLIADEPTTALVALLLVTHDFGVIANSTERLIVIDGGKALEAGDTASIIVTPKHEQTRRMLDACRLNNRNVEAPTETEPVLEASGLSVVYHERPLGRIWHRQSLAAVNPTDLCLRRGETLSVVGESGCGKSSLARALLGLVATEGGTVSYLGKRLPAQIRQRNRKSKTALQMVFQDPTGSLDPSWRISRSVAEPLRGVPAATRASQVAEAFERVGLAAELHRRYPHQLSGGQAQRAAIARALVNKPDVLVCDEAVAALDAPTRQDVLSLLLREQQDHGLSILFISHDLSVVQRLSHRLLVMYLGSVVESGPSSEIFKRPRHPYTRALLDAMLTVDARPQSPSLLDGEPPSPLLPPSGCPFHPRCRYVEKRCRVERPVLRPVGGEAVACHRAEAIDLANDNY